MGEEVEWDARCFGCFGREDRGPYRSKEVAFAKNTRIYQQFMQERDRTTYVAKPHTPVNVSIGGFNRDS